MGFFWGLIFGPGIFCRVLFEALGILGGFDFCPIRSSPSLEIRDLDDIQVKLLADYGSNIFSARPTCFSETWSISQLFLY